MSLEQNVHGVFDWYIPSPSTTPQSATFSNNPFRTPKPKSHSSDLNNARTTPHVNGHCSPTSTPPSVVFSPADRRTPSCLGQISPVVPAPDFYANTPTSNLSLPLLPIEPAQRLSASLDPSCTEGTYNSRPDQRLSPATTSDFASMEPSQTRTPPPTRDSSSKRRAQQAKVAKLSTPVSIGSRRMSTPDHSHLRQGGSFLPQPSPLQFPSFEFSPDVSHFAAAGVVTAPAYPASRLFWDPDGNMNGGDLDIGGIAYDPFAASPSANMAATSWADFGTPMARACPETPTSAAFETPKPGNFFAHSTEFSLTGNLVMEVSNVAPQRTMSLSASSGVDPNLLIGFSNQSNLAPMPSSSTTSPPPPASVLRKQPYEHQLQESLREQGLEQARKARKERLQLQTRTNVAPSKVSAKQSGKAVLQRSVTEDRIERRSRHFPSFPSSRETPGLGNTHINDHVPRRSSPLKRQSQNPLVAVSEMKKVRVRSSVRLTIDADGRARTENSILEEDEELTEDESPKVKYPGLWDGDESDTSSDLSVGYVNSQNNSFAAPDSVDRKVDVSKSGRNSNRSHHTMPPKSSSVINSAAAVLRKPDSASRLQQRTSELLRSERSRRHSMSSFNGSSPGEVASDNDTLTGSEDIAGDAQQALRKVMEGRQRRHQRTKGQELDAHNQRWTRALNQPSTHPGADYHDPPYGRHSNMRHSSPTTITETDLATPSTDHGYVNSEGTRCICGSIDGNEGLMIQCESCLKWQHVKCIGLSTQRLPAVHVCGFCAGPSPAVRGGRVRQPHKTNASFSSPLGHKHVRYR